jgi:Superfamily II DNA and RNA helicases
MKFTELPLSERVLAGIEKAGFVEPTEVQANVLPVSLSGKDVMVQSKTGSGKTAIYVLTVLKRFEESEGKTCSLVVAPTRELALQIEEDARLLSSYIPEFKVGCFYGGVGYGKQSEELNSGLSLYVGTPGRLLDFAKSGKIDFRQFNLVVLDEADRMFDMGFYPDIQQMFKRMGSPKERQTMLFSATLSTNVRNLAWQYMNEPAEIEVHPEEVTVKAITQELFHVTKDEKFQLLLQLLAKINPASCLIFTNTKDKAVEVSKRLNLNGYKCAYLMGDMAQKDRIKTLNEMKEGKLSFLVATDVAARGLQIDDLALVVNYDIPEDYEAYVHRIGRTARAGKSGKAITLACEEYIYGLEAIENYIGMKIPVLWADECELSEVEDKSAGMKIHTRSARSSSSSKRGGERRQGGSRTSSGNRRSGERRPSSGKTGERRVRPAAAKGERKSGENKGPKTDYSKLSSLSLDERMAYYRKEFNSNPKAGQKKSAPQKKTSAAPKKSESVKKPMPAVSSVPLNNTDPKVKKINFLAKIVNIFKKKG